MLYRVNLAMNSIQLTTIAQVVVNPTTIWSRLQHPYVGSKINIYNYV
jgi:hypothetical protein